LHDLKDKEKECDSSSGTSSSDSESEVRSFMIKATKKPQSYDAVLPKSNNKDKIAACIELETDD